MPRKPRSELEFAKHRMMLALEGEEDVRGIFESAETLLHGTAFAITLKKEEGPVKTYKKGGRRRVARKGPAKK